MPTNLEEWIVRVTEMAEEIDSKVVASAYQGNADAKAILEAWALEMQAAALFLAAYTGAVEADMEALVAIANTIIDTVQAILMALGIALLLKKLKKGKKPTEYVVTLNVYKKELGQRVNPIPSSSDADKKAEADFLGLRVDWSIHHLLTLLQGLKMQEGFKPGSKELVWKAHLDASTCSICRFMHNKKSIHGDFLPVIMKQFPTFKAYVAWMGFPHAHPRCRCFAEPA